MKYLLAITVAVFFCGLLPTKGLAQDFVSRRDGFLQIWGSIGRPALETREKPFSDVPEGSPGFTEITYAKARGLVDDDVSFGPSEPLSPYAALLWLFRTRNVEPFDASGGRMHMELSDPEHIPALKNHYKLAVNLEAKTLTRDELLSLMQTLDKALLTEDHEISLYSEKFHGDGTAFGETFDMHALTAAHRTYPHNTLVRVTNPENGKSVVVRINDRGPFVQGRDMDLSLRAFTTIAERGRGKIRATFERLGDISLAAYCSEERFQRRLGRNVILDPGIPHAFALGGKLSLSSKEPFVVRDIVYPDGVRLGQQTWVTKDEVFDFTPSVPGTYRFFLGTAFGRNREMAMEVVECGT